MNLSNSTVRRLNPTLVAPMIEVTSKQNWKHKKNNFAWILKNHWFQWSDKVNYFEKATKIERQDCAKFLWPSQNILTLSNHWKTWLATLTWSIFKTLNFFLLRISHEFVGSCWRDHREKVAATKQNCRAGTSIKKQTKDFCPGSLLIQG